MEMTEFLKKSRELPWKIHTYTSVQELMKEEGGSLSLLVVSESAYGEELQKLEALRTVVLSESGVMKWEGVCYVDKYRQAEDVLKELFQIYMEIADTRLPRLKNSGNITFIGNFKNSVISCAYSSSVSHSAMIFSCLFNTHLQDKVIALLYPLFKISAVGAGDVKLLGAAAGYFPFEKIFLFAFVSLLIAAIISQTQNCQHIISFVL